MKHWEIKNQNEVTRVYKNIMLAPRNHELIFLCFDGLCWPSIIYMKEIEKTTLEGSFHGQRCFLCESQHVKSGKKGKIEKKENDLRWEVLLSVNYDDFLGLFTEKRGGWSFYIILLILISLAYFKFMFIIHSH